VRSFPVEPKTFAFKAHHSPLNLKPFALKGWAIGVEPKTFADKPLIMVDEVKALADEPQTFTDEPLSITAEAKHLWLNLKHSPMYL